VCDYCGCRDFPLIGRLSEEHDAIADAAGLLRQAIGHGDAATATTTATAPTTAEATAMGRLDDLLDLLIPHTATEEHGLFAELRAEGSLTTAVDDLCAQHDDIHGTLGRIDRAAPDWPIVLAVLDRLHRHIDNEEHGLFPAAVVALPIAAWDRITPTNRITPTEPTDRRPDRPHE
jgi:hypothetical protein